MFDYTIIIFSISCKVKNTVISICDNDLVEIKKSLHGDDLFLKKKELSNGLRVSHVIHTKEQDYVPLESTFTEGALSYGGCNMTRND